MITRRPGPLALRAIGLPFVAFALFAMFAVFSGCGLDGTGIVSIDADAGADRTEIHCTGAAQCDDGNVCTTDACGVDGICTSAPLADGDAPASTQTKGNCHKIVCTKGAPSSVADDTNAPAAPDACTINACKAGTPQTSAATDGTTCAISGSPGTCTGGTCVVACKIAESCPSKGPCQTASCDGSKGQCVYQNISDGTPTPGFTQLTGDCTAHVCRSGADTAEADNTDLPATVNDCETPTCTGGMPSQSFGLHPIDSSCSTYMGTLSGFCDGAGHCNACVHDSECPGPTNDCQHPTCASGTCTTTKISAGTATVTNPPQVAGDCKTIVCDGLGATTTSIQNGDLPGSLGGGCQPGVCTTGVPSHGSSADGSSCGSGLACLGGQCSGCTTNPQCQPPAFNTCGGGGTPNTCGCTPTTCAIQKVTCGTIPNGCGGTLNCNDSAKDGSETDIDCGGGTTAAGVCANLCAQGSKCTTGSDCAGGSCADGVCCNTACAGSCFACSAAKKGQGLDGVCGAVKAGFNDPKNVCAAQSVSTCGDTGTTCNGAGACQKYANGTVCQPPTCAGTVLTKADACSGGSCTAPAPATVDCAPYECLAGACTSTCNLDTDCASPASHYCNAGHQCVPRLTTGSACTIPGATTQCVSGSCANGFCCNTACNGTCQACSNALTGGTNGTCTSVTAGTTEPRGSCAVQPSTGCGTDGKCAAGGVCEKYGSSTICVGASCSSGSQTTQGNCNGTGSCTGSVISTCTPYICGATACQTACGAVLTGDTNCIATDYCDGVGAGVCQARKSAGTACTTDDQCSSASCLGGYCCGAACPSSAPCAATACAAVTGACQGPAGDVLCGAAGSCTSAGTTMTGLSACNGAGSCVANADFTCGGANLCIDGTGCAGCSADSECNAFAWCLTGTCVGKQQAGTGCITDSTPANQCLSGACPATTCQ